MFVGGRKWKDVDCVMSQIKDLHYNSADLYHNCIIRHILTKWTYEAVGICRWHIIIILKRLGIRKYVSSGLASCIFTILFISIIFRCSLLICYH